MYTVKQLAELAGVSVRTLHYYDEIGLLQPGRIGENGYRYYGRPELLRLQQIRFFREMGLSLKEIRKILDVPEFDLLAALHTHREAIEARIRRLQELIKTVDGTILNLTGDIEMSSEGLFSGFSAEEEQRYKDEARQLWGEEEVNDSYRRWDGYTDAQKSLIQEEGDKIYQDLVTQIAAVRSPESAEVQEVVGRWHQHMRYFYEPSVERLRGLGQLYVDHPDFARKFRGLHPGLPEFMQQAILFYCDQMGAA